MIKKENYSRKYQKEFKNKLAGIISVDTILGDPGAVSRAERKGVTKVFKNRRKSHWVPTLTGPFPNGQVNAGSLLGTKNALYYCAQSANSISWVLFVNSYTAAIVSSQLPGSFPSLCVQGKIAWPFRNGPVRVGTQGLFRPCLKTFVAPFLQVRLTVPGSPRMP